MVFLSPGNARFGGKRGHGRVDLQTLSLSLSLHSFLSTVSAPFPPCEWLYSLAPLDSSPSGGRHLNWTVAIAGVRLLRGSERGRESEKASSFEVPFYFGAASFKSYRRRGNYSPKSVEIVCKRSQPQLYR